MDSLSVSLSVSSVSLSVCLYTFCLPVFISACLSGLSLPGCLSLFLSVCTYLCLSVCLSVRLSHRRALAAAACWMNISNEPFMLVIAGSVGTFREKSGSLGFLKNSLYLQMIVFYLAIIPSHPASRMCVPFSSR